ncbi:MAG: hypothetical protein P1P93_11270 [Gammaproteobacteria bacterium]|nr:hypothetical protein [Gammaproteobacteria bacterium]
MTLSIGAYLPDIELDTSSFCQALTGVAIELVQYRQHRLQSNKPNISLSFLMPSREEKPDFEGMRLHSFDANSNTLKIESAVPPQMVQSTHAKHYVVAAMQDAIDGAYDFFEAQKVKFERDDYLQLIDTMSTKHSVAKAVH